MIADVRGRVIDVSLSAARALGMIAIRRGARFSAMTARTKTPA